MQALAQLWLLAALPTLTGVSVWRALGEVVSAAGGAAGGAGPSFAPRQRSAVLAARGQHAELECAVHRLGDKSVSWVRSRDLQILSHAGVVFTADSRVSAAEGGGPAGATRHTLRVERLRPADGGRYECQVNTDPKMSLFFNLTVLDEAMPRVVVSALNAHVLRVARRGAGTLACSARYEPPPRALPLPPLAVVWRRMDDDTPLTLQSSRGGVSLDTERWGAARVVSRLTLAELRRADAGQYECRAAPTTTSDTSDTSSLADIVAVVDADAADTITLLVEDNEEAVEAMQRDQSPYSAAAPTMAVTAATAAVMAAGAVLAVLIR